MSNDFTKEELKFMQDYIYLGVRDKKNHELLMRMDRKLQSLIDNYSECEHEFERKLMQIDLCDKCKNFKFIFKGVEDE